MGISFRRIHVRWTVNTLRFFSSRWKRFFVLIIFLLVISQALFHVSPNGSMDLDEPQIMQLVRGCNCTRPYLWPPNSSFLPPNSSLLPFNSTCSDEGTFYRLGQNVISFSLHLSPERREHVEPLYLEGLDLNVKAAREVYPNFTLRIYTDLELTPESPFCPFLCNNSHVFWCDMQEIAGPLVASEFLNARRMMVWRVLPLGDPTVDVFLSRDLDSVVSPREAAAVSDWLWYRPSRGIHVMRDHIHHGSRMMGGTWGARNQWLANASQLQARIIAASRTLDISPGNDQHILNRVVRRSDMLAHDSYHCISRRSYQSVWRPFPTQRQGPDTNGLFTDFVGNPGLGRSAYKFPTCPNACRPEYGQNWTYC